MLLAPLLLVAAPRLVTAQEADEVASPTPGEVRTALDELLVRLDDARFDIRQRAVEELEAWVEQTDDPAVLGRELRRVLLDPSTSFEVRSRIAPLVERLPAELPASEVADRLQPADLTALIDKLDDDSYATRVGAVERLEWLAQQPTYTGDVLVALKAHRARAGASEVALRQVERLIEVARRAWLLSDPAEWQLPEVSDQQITAWVDALCQAPADAAEPARQPPAELAEQELVDLLAREEYVERVRTALEARQADAGLHPLAIERIERVLHWLQPALVAEYWQTVDVSQQPRSRHLGVQYLLVDVPNVPEGGERASHFDRIDDRVAHCVSGNSLSEGEYPVGVAFPHPQQEEAFFQLVNLPTPRRRLAYEFYRHLDETDRLRDISRRTLARMLTAKRPLSQREVLMLTQLDPDEVSQFAGSYFLAVDDQPLVDAMLPVPAGRLSLHGTLCLVLARGGTHAAVEGIMRAIEQERFLPPTIEGPCEMPWIALLAIAARDPWPEVDSWLGDLIPRTDPLVIPQREGPRNADVPELGYYPELGATAAALLLKRRGVSTSAFGLQPFGLQLLVQLGCPGHRFLSEPARADVMKWWTNESTRLSDQAATTRDATAR